MRYQILCKLIECLTKINILKIFTICIIIPINAILPFFLFLKDVLIDYY